MSDADAKVNPNDVTEADSNLRNAAEQLAGMGCGVSARLVAQAIATLARLAADNARLAAEVERLTPKPMTAREACMVFKAKSYRKRAWAWSEYNDQVCTIESQYESSEHVRFTAFEADLIAQCLLRDAGPSDAKGGG